MRLLLPTIPWQGTASVTCMPHSAGPHLAWYKILPRQHAEITHSLASMPRDRTGAEHLCLAHVREGLHDGRHVGKHQRLRAQLGARRGQREDDVCRGRARRRTRRVCSGGRRACHFGRAQGARACRNKAASARQAASKPGEMGSSRTRPTPGPSLQAHSCRAELALGPGQQKYQAVRAQPAGRHSPLDVLMRAIAHASPPWLESPGWKRGQQSQQRRQAVPVRCHTLRPCSQQTEGMCVPSRRVEKVSRGFGPASASAAHNDNSPVATARTLAARSVPPDHSRACTHVLRAGPGDEPAASAPETSRAASTATIVVNVLAAQDG